MCTSRQYRVNQQQWKEEWQHQNLWGIIANGWVMGRRFGGWPRKQEAQLMLTNPRDAFGGQSRSPNMVPFDVRYGFLLVFCSNFVPKTQRFWNIWLHKCCNLENQVRGPSRSLEMSPFDRVHMTSYWRSIVNMILSHVISEIFNVKNIMTLKSGSDVTQGHWKGYHTGYGFLLVFYSNFVPKMHHFWDIRLVTIPWPWNLG